MVRGAEHCMMGNKRISRWSEALYISELSRLSGASPKAIRLYESLALLHVPRRGQYRWYNQQHVAFVQLIKEAQRLGVLLAEIQALVSAPHQLDWVALHQLLSEKQQQLQQQIAAQQLTLQHIVECQRLIQDCLQQDAATSSTCADPLQKPA